MANPQLHNGHTRVANEILNQIMKTNLNGTQFRLVIAIWRFTYGFQRKEYEMSTGYLAQLIDTKSRSYIDRELTALIDRKIVTVKEIGQKGARVLSFNKNYKEWADKNTSKEEAIPEIKPKKKPTTKKRKYNEDNTYYKMAVYFYNLVNKVAQDAGLPHLTKKANMQTWADDMRKLVEIDEVDKKLAKDVMDWVVNDSFWKTNVLSARKLRDKFPELAIKMKAQKQPEKPKQPKDHRDKDIELQQWIAEGNDPDEFNWND
ncbi:replication protein [Virgibacillus salarius]|uniref:replication protein n=1 Tax=Virgibacillus salarius TaxID=447199 RepID=UPI002492E220|nr:replication protein [Virgibacillus salarius]WBX80144.1 replication protein [Virgibacillus salarius]